MMFLKTYIIFMRVEKQFLMLLIAKYFNFQQKKVYGPSNVKILTPKQIIQRLGIVLAGNTLKNLLNKIRQILYSQYRTKEITKKVYNNNKNSTKV